MATDFEIATSVLSDVFKDVYGYRPRGLYNFDKMTLEEVEAETQKLIDRIQEEREQEEAEERAIEARVQEALTATPLRHNPFAALRSC